NGSFEHVASEQVRATAAPLLKDGFFAFDPARVQAEVDALPWVRQTEVRRQWPDQVSIRVHELHPIAHWNDTQLIDRSGALFAVPGGKAVPELPHLAGPAGSEQEVWKFYRHAGDRLQQVGLRVTGVELEARGSWR